MAKHDDFIKIQFQEVAEELLIWLEFYTPYEADRDGYHFRLYEGLDSERLPKLAELYSCFSKILDFIFMGERYNKNETYYSLEDYEIYYLGDIENTENDIASIFELGRCWGEYISIYGQSYPDDWERDVPKIGNEATHKLLSRLKYLRSRRSVGQKKGAAGNTAIGEASSLAYREFVSRNFSEGLTGRTKEHVYAECLVQIETVVRLANRISKNVKLTDKEKEQYDKLDYLMALTKQKDGLFYPYKLNALKPKLSPLLKK